MDWFLSIWQIEFCVQHAKQKVLHHFNKGVKGSWIGKIAKAIGFSFCRRPHYLYIFCEYSLRTTVMLHRRDLNIFLWEVLQSQSNRYWIHRWVKVCKPSVFISQFLKSISNWITLFACSQANEKVGQPSVPAVKHQTQANCNTQTTYHTCVYLTPALIYANLCVS